MEVVGIILGVLAVLLIVLFITIVRLVQVCQPNEVLIFSGGRRRVADRSVGYRIVKGDRGIRTPLIERVDKMDLTNMIIDVSAVGAYSKGGVPLTVQGVANVKVAGHEPVLNNAIERFLGKSREEIMSIAKATLEGSLRGVLSTLTPEQVNDDKLLFAEKLVHEVEADMTALGLVVDTLKIQNVQDDVKYLDSIGRKQTAEVLRVAKIAEAKATAQAAIRAAENRQREVTAQIQAKISVAKADAQKRLTDALTKRDAVVAEENATVAAALAQAQAEVQVQKARVEQIRRQLEADVIAPAKAASQEMEARAKADAAPIVQDGKARAEVLAQLAASWEKAGDNARQIFLLQKLDKVIGAITDVIGDTPIEKVAFIAGGDGKDSLPLKTAATLEGIQQVLGIDLKEKIDGWTNPRKVESRSVHEPEGSPETT